jgi:hypothetical protein
VVAVRPVIVSAIVVGPRRGASVPQSEDTFTIPIEQSFLNREFIQPDPASLLQRVSKCSQSGKVAAGSGHHLDRGVQQQALRQVQAFAHRALDEIG